MHDNDDELAKKLGSEDHPEAGLIRMKIELNRQEAQALADVLADLDLLHPAKRISNRLIGAIARSEIELSAERAREWAEKAPRAPLNPKEIPSFFHAR